MFLPFVQPLQQVYRLQPLADIKEVVGRRFAVIFFQQLLFFYRTKPGISDRPEHGSALYMRDVFMKFFCKRNVSAMIELMLAAFGCIPNWPGGRLQTMGYTRKVLTGEWIICKPGLS
jgi:hypothetical protein